MNRGASRYPLLLTATAVLILVGVVAVASSGSTSGGTNRTRPPADTLVDTFWSLMLVLVVVAAGVFVYGLTQRKAIAREMASRRYPRSGVATFLLFLLIAGVISYFRLRGWKPPAGQQPGEPIFPVQQHPLPRSGNPDVVDRTPEFAWIPVLVIVGLAALAIAAYVLAERRQRRSLAPDDAAAAEEVAGLLDDSFDDLRAERDPRRAVIAAYARLESALGAAGLPRMRAETAEEYVTRILGRLEVERRPVEKLTKLFEAAKFSHHDVDEAMKDEAIGALADIRDELRAAASRRAAESLLAVPSEPESAAPS